MGGGGAGGRASQNHPGRWRAQPTPSGPTSFGTGRVGRGPCSPAREPSGRGPGRHLQGRGYGVHGAEAEPGSARRQNLRRHRRLSGWLVLSPRSGCRPPAPHFSAKGSTFSATRCSTNRSEPAPRLLCRVPGSWGKGVRFAGNADELVFVHPHRRRSRLSHPRGDVSPRPSGKRPGWQEPGRALCASQMLGDRNPLFALCSHGSAFIPGNTLRVEVS